MAEKISARKGDNQTDSQKTAHAVLNGLQAPEPVQQPTITGQAIADQIAAKLNRKLGYVPMDKAETDTQPTGLKKLKMGIAFQYLQVAAYKGGTLLAYKVTPTQFGCVNDCLLGHSLKSL